MPLQTLLHGFEQQGFVFGGKAMAETNTFAEAEILHDRVKGCLFGVAIGDALGAPFEHLLPGQTNQALERMDGVITDFQPYWNHPPGSWTDDTGMTLASCHAFNDHVSSGNKNKSLETCFRHRFKEWFLAGRCRNPGKTVRYAAIFGEPDIDSWANGALMRIAPVALFSHLKGQNRLRTAQLAHKIAALTHGHPMATLPAVECVLTLRSILVGDDALPQIAGPFQIIGRNAMDSLQACEEINNETLGTINSYEEYVSLRHAPLERVPVTTGLWMWRHVTERILGLCPGVALKTLPSFEEGMIRAVNESVDRDTAGAVAGAILGAYWGHTEIPTRWSSRVEDSQGISQLADCFLRTIQESRVPGNVRETPWTE